MDPSVRAHGLVSASSSEPVHILLVEDNRADARYLEIVLREKVWLQSFHLHHVTSMDDAVAALAERSYDAVLLDLGLPDVSGAATVSEMMRHTPELPIVVLSGSMDPRLAQEVVEAGAQDFLIKGEDGANLVARAVSFALRRKRAELRLKHLAHFDELTGLPNRSLFAERLDRGLLRARRHSSRLAVMFVDLDRFKHINDTLGHPVGDQVLSAVGHRIKDALRSSDTVARIGGDEFAVVLEDIKDASGAAAAAQHVFANLVAPVPADGNEIHASGSIGIALYPDSGADANTLLHHADLAMYAAKAMGPGHFQIFGDDLDHAARRRIEYERRLRRALDHHEFELHYQPQFRRDAASVDGFEALVRWDPLGDGVLTMPGEFIPEAEHCGVIVPLGEWILHEACAEMQRWNRVSNWEQRVSVNVSARQLEHPAFVETLDHVLTDTGLSATQLEIELTESSLLRDADSSRELLSAIRGRGIGIALDDFGTGYCSLSYLKDLPVQRIKIDRSFVSELGRDVNVTLVKAIVEMAHALELSVVAEGVETAPQLEQLRQLGVDLFQGFLMARPTNAEHARKAWCGHS